MKPLFKEENLVKGVFTYEEAFMIINNLFKSKIQMHTQASFSNFLKKGCESHEDTTRKQELIYSLERLVDALKEQNNGDNNFRIECILKVECVKEPNSTTGVSNDVA
jgi:hypothetical protein